MFILYRNNQIVLKNIEKRASIIHSFTDDFVSSSTKVFVMDTLRNSLEYCAKACQSLILDFIMTGGKVSKQYLQKKVKEIANIQKKILFLARQIIFKKLDFIPEFYEILQISERSQKSMRSLVTSLVYQYTNLKQRFQISIFKDKIEQLQKHTNYILQRLNLIVKHWDVRTLIKMSQDVTKREETQIFFKQKCIYLSDIKEQNQTVELKKSQEKRQDTKVQILKEELQLNKEQEKQKEPQETVEQVEKEIEISSNSAENEKQQEEEIQTTKNQEAKKLLTSIDVD